MARSPLWLPIPEYNYFFSPRSPVLRVRHFSSILPVTTEINPEPTKSLVRLEIDADQFRIRIHTCQLALVCNERFPSRRHLGSSGKLLSVFHRGIGFQSFYNPQVG